MDTLIATPYNLSLGDLVIITVSAHNANGWGTLSLPNTYGATVNTVPAKMNDPFRGNGTS